MQSKRRKALLESGEWGHWECSGPVAAESESTEPSMCERSESDPYTKPTQWLSQRANQSLVGPYKPRTATHSSPPCTVQCIAGILSRLSSSADKDETLMLHFHCGAA